MLKLKKEDIKARECRFAVHCSNPRNGGDLHLIKEIIHTNSGEQIPHVRLQRDYKRPFWITKKGARTYEQKKEQEKLENLNKYETTQTNIVQSIARALGEPWFKGNLRKLFQSPYIYGADILSTALIKHDYKVRWPDVNTPYTNAVFDTETDVLNGTNAIMMATISFKDRVYTAVRKDFVAGHADAIHRIHECLIKYLGHFVEQRGIKYEVELVDTSAEVSVRCLNKAHQWMPDFVSIWNMDFDIPKVVESLQAERIDPAQVFSDPSIPTEFKYFEYKKGAAQKVTASGKFTPVKPANRWHTVFTPASFYIIDAMCVYRQIRLASAEEPSYSLDSILNKELNKEGIRKLRFKEADHLSGIDWHRFMQEFYPFEYIIYNVFDCISMELLDEKTKDLSITMPMFANCSDFQHFKSQPRRLVDRLHFEFLDKEVVIATTSNDMEVEADENILDLKDWIK